MLLRHLLDCSGCALCEIKHQNELLGLLLQLISKTLSLQLIRKQQKRTEQNRTGSVATYQALFELWKLQRDAGVFQIDQIFGGWGFLCPLVMLVCASLQLSQHTFLFLHHSLADLCLCRPSDPCCCTRNKSCRLSKALVVALLGTPRSSQGQCSSTPPSLQLIS